MHRNNDCVYFYICEMIGLVIYWTKSWNVLEECLIPILYPNRHMNHYLLLKNFNLLEIVLP